MAQDMGVALYRRYSPVEAASVLGISTGELEQLRAQGHIAYLQVTTTHISFFGCQLLSYLRECIVPVGQRPAAEPNPGPRTGDSSPTAAPKAAAELVSVNEALTMLGIGRTKLYELINSREIESVKIGTRTLLKRESLRRFTGTEPE